MKLNDLIQQWDNAVDAIQQSVAHEAELEDATLQVRTNITAGVEGWRELRRGEVCWFNDNDENTGDCKSCTKTWTPSPC